MYSRSTAIASTFDFAAAIVIASADVDVRRHVDQVTRFRRDFSETRRHSASARSGVSRSLDGVDVVVIRAAVIRIATQNTFEHRHDLERAFRRLAIERPELPRTQVHHAFGVERGGVEIVGIVFRQLAHRVFVVDFELAV